MIKGFLFMKLSSHSKLACAKMEKLAFTSKLVTIEIEKLAFTNEPTPKSKQGSLRENQTHVKFKNHGF
jgi:hypothetical protein